MKRRIDLLIGIACLIGAIVLLRQALKRPGPHEIARQFIDVYYGEGNFSDRHLVKMMRLAGWKPGDPWCMFFVKGVYMLAYPQYAAEINDILACYTQESWLNAQDNSFERGHNSIFEIITSGDSNPGDIVIWRSNANPLLGHAAIVSRNMGGLNWETVEGNAGFWGDKTRHGIMKFNRELVPGKVGEQFTLLGYLRMKM